MHVVGNRLACFSYMCIWKNVLFNLKFHFLFLLLLLAINEMQTFLHILVLFRFNASLLYMQEKP